MSTQRVIEYLTCMDCGNTLYEALEALDKVVNKFLEDGYTVTGGVTVCYDKESHEYCVIQALIKYES